MKPINPVLLACVFPGEAAYGAALVKEDIHAVSVNTVRRAAVVLAVGCATALTATAASAAPANPVHSARPSAIPTCARDNLKLHMSQGSGAAGSFTYLLRFTNTSAAPATCSGSQASRR